MCRSITSMVACAVIVCMSAWISAQELRGNPKRGQGIYEQHCQRCHGPAGDGLGPDARDLIVLPANFHLAKSRMKTDSQLLMAIMDGVLFTPMHAWRGKLTEDQMVDVVSYIRFLAPFMSVS